MTKIENAILFAVSAHADMTRKGKARPYILHPIEAMTIVAAMTEDTDVIAAAVLHDVVEDTDISAEDIEQAFGKRVRDLVISWPTTRARRVSASLPHGRRSRRLVQITTINDSRAAVPS